jgi:uncharacterized membrane protein YphA (DoxX/SURF4 family)
VHIVLWILQALLGAMFLMVGIAKATQPRAKLLEMERMKWVEDISPSNLKGIGVLEILAGIGLIVPPLMGILPWLAPLAAVGLALTMIGAAILHVRRGETSLVASNLVLLAIAAFVAYGRFVLVPA